MRRRLAHWLRNLADSVDRSSGPRCFAGYFNLIPGKGIVITRTEGVQISPDVPGAPLYFMEEEYERAYAHQGKEKP